MIPMMVLNVVMFYFFQKSELLNLGVFDTIGYIHVYKKHFEVLFEFIRLKQCKATVLLCQAKINYGYTCLFNLDISVQDRECVILRLGFKYFFQPFYSRFFVSLGYII